MVLISYFLAKISQLYLVELTGLVVSWYTSTVLKEYFDTHSQRRTTPYLGNELFRNAL